MLDKTELLTYQRQIGIPGWGRECQEKLKSSTVFVAGAGGLGSPVCMYLAAAGIGTLRICDYDRVEPTNLNRQILHSEESIGRLKVESASETIHRVNHRVTVQTVPAVLNRKTITPSVGSAGIIVDCLDNFETRLLLNEFSVRNGIPMVHGGVSGFQGQVTFINPPVTACLACFLPSRIRKEKVPVAGACAGVIGTLQATEVLKHLTGLGETLRNRLLVWDGQEMRFSMITLKKNESCGICGKKVKKPRE